MTPDEAETTADIFRMLIQEYSHELATEALTEDFVDWASSVNIIINKGAAGPKSMDKPTFASRAAFIDGQGKQPQIPFTKIRVWPGCRHVAMRWKTGKSANGHLTEVDDIPVHGHVIIDVVPAEAGNRFNWRIKNIWSEFNSGAWLVNLGVFKPAMLPNADDVRHMREFGDGDGEKQTNTSMMSPEEDGVGHSKEVGDEVQEAPVEKQETPVEKQQSSTMSPNPDAVRHIDKPPGWSWSAEDARQGAAGC